jgi:hypothetical protein
VPIKVDIPHLAFIKGSYSLCLEFIFFLYSCKHAIITLQIASALFDADQRLTRNTAIRSVLLFAELAKRAGICFQQCLKSSQTQENESTSGTSPRS